MSSTSSADSDDPVALISDALNSSSNTSTAQVGIAAGSFLGLAIFTLFAFSLLRPNNKIVYQPKLKYAEGDKKPPPMSDSIFGWIPPVLNQREEDLLPLLGLDAITFLRFCRMVRNIVSVLAILMCAVLIPVDVAYNLTAGKDSSSKQSGLNMLTMADVSGNFIWAHVAMSYIGTFIALGFIWVNYRQMVRLRWIWFRSEEYQSHLYSRSLMITGVGKQMRSDEALAGMLSSIGMPYPTTDVHISRVVGQLPELIEQHDDTVRQLEKVLAKWLKDPNKVPEKRPTMRVGGTCCFGGRQVDAVDYLTKRINALEGNVNQWRERIAERKPETHGFAAMATVPFAHAAAKSLKGKHPRGLTIALAPPPKDIIWKNLTLTRAQRFKSSTWGFILLSILLFINAVPLVAVALISQMSKFEGVLPFLASWQSSSQYTFSAVAGLAPPAISGAFGYFLPPLMRVIGKYRGVSTRNRLDRVITSQYFGFLVISQFIVFTLVGVAITTIATIVHYIEIHKSAGTILGYLRDKVLGTVKYQYLNMANYWLTWIPLRLWMSTFDISQAIKLVLTWIQSAFLGRTPRDIREFTKPPNFEYSVYYANMLFIFAVGMLYATLAPLVLAFIAVTLWVSYFLYKYIHIYVAVTKNESGGRLWRVVINRLLVCVVFMQLILALVVALDQHYQAFACLPPVIFVVIFKIYCRRAFDQTYDWYIPDANEMSKLKAHTGDASHHRLARRFGHPSLHQKLFTPMVHAKVKHLLPKVYQGRLEDTGIHDVDGRKADVEEVTGGLKIAAVEEQDCMYDPQLDSDAASIFSSTTAGPFRGPPSRAGTFDQNFQTQYDQYMAGGPLAARSVEAFEMGHLATGSQDNLLEKAAPPGVYGGAYNHVRKGSTGTQLSFGSTSRLSPATDNPAGGYARTAAQGNYFPPPGQARPIYGRQDSNGMMQYPGQNSSPQQGYGTPAAYPAGRVSPGPFRSYAPSANPNVPYRSVSPASTVGGQSSYRPSPAMTPPFQPQQPYHQPPQQPGSAAAMYSAAPAPDSAAAMYASANQQPPSYQQPGRPQQNNQQPPPGGQWYPPPQG